MAGSQAGRRLVAASATELILAGHDLLAVLDDPGRRASALDRLASVAETRIAGLAAFSAERVQGFEAADVPEARGEAAEDVLAVALGELTIAQTLIAAATVAGEPVAPEPAAGEPVDAEPVDGEPVDAEPVDGEPVDAEPADAEPARGARARADAELLRSALAEAATVPATMADASASAAAGGDGAAAAGAGADGPPAADGRAREAAPAAATAVQGLREQVEATLSAIVDRSARAGTRVFTALLDAGPGAVKRTIDSLGERVQLGPIANRIFRAALWALDQALGALGRLIPVRLLADIRARVHELYERLRTERATDVAVGAVLGVPAARAYAARALDRPGLEPERLAATTTELAELTERYARTMRILDGISTAVTLVAASLAVTAFAVPQLALLVLGAQTLVVAAVLIIGIDYVDVHAGPDLVRGVHTVLRTVEA